MRNTLYWTAGGLGLAVGCGLAGLAHLSATLVTLTVFLSAQALFVVGLDFLSVRRKAPK